MNRDGTTVEAAAEERGIRKPSWEEGPADLRLVPLAVAAWLAAACAVGVAGWWTLTGVVVCVLGAAVLLTPASARWFGGASGEGGVDDQGAVGGAGRADGVAEGRVRRGVSGGRLRATACAGVLLCAAAGATSAGLHAADLRRGPVPALAQEYARAQLEVTVTSDPRLTRPRVRGSETVPVSVVLNGEVTRAERSDGTAHRTRAPVLLIVPPGEGRDEWLRLLPSTRLKVGARLAPPSHPGDPFAAVLKIRGPDRPGSSAHRARCNGRRGSCAPGCGGRPTASTRTRGPCCPDWSSGTPRGSDPSCGTPSRRPTSRTCSLSPEAICQWCCFCSSAVPGGLIRWSGAGSHPGWGCRCG